MFRRILSVGLVCGFAFAACADNEMDDLVKMAKAGVDDEVMLAYVNSAPPDTYRLSSDDIVMLKDLGVSSDVITAVLNHENGAASKATPLIADTTKEVLAPTPKTPPPPLPDNLDESYFYDALQPYGNWVAIDGSWCWVPNASTMDPDWRPYATHGHWVCTDWGWAWESDYTWGWAPFHYGRWHHNPDYGWVWTPGTQWGPAWVVWRCNDNYFGWAPLPPQACFDDRAGFTFRNHSSGGDFDFELGQGDYFFVSSSHFCDGNVWVSRAPDQEVEVFYHKTVVINKYDVDASQRIINRGPDPQRVSKLVKKKLVPIPIVVSASPQSKGSVAGHTPQMMVFRPTIHPGAKLTPVQVKAKSVAVAPASVPAKMPKAIPVDKSKNARMDAAAQSALVKHRSDADAAEKEHTHLEQAAKAEKELKKREELQKAADLQKKKADTARSKQKHAEKFKKSLTENPDDVVPPDEEKKVEKKDKMDKKMKAEEK